MTSTTHAAGRQLAARVALVGLLCQAGVAAAQTTGVALQGKLYHSVTLKPVAGAVIVIEELSRHTESSGDGAFAFNDVPPGIYHVFVSATGLAPLRKEVTVADAAVTLDLGVDPQLHYTEVVSVSPQARDQFASYQPTSVLSGQDLSKQLQGTLGGTLEAQPGMAQRSFGPGPSRPVIRGLDGDRVLVLEDGQRSGDLSSQSGDHGVTVNPAAASRIEIVRGPAALLYGSNAIGGLVNVITETIPTRPVTGASGGVVLDAASAAREGGVSADITAGNGRWAIHAGGSGRRSGDVRTPEGAIANTQSRGGFGQIGLSWTGTNRYAGASYGYDDTRYGIPFIEDGQIQLTPRRHNVSFRAGGRQAGPLESYRATVTHRRYRHDELQGNEIGTRFSNDTTEAEVLLQHRPAGRLKGTVGGWFLNRAFGAIGEEALAPPVDQRGVAAFIYEEVGWPHVSVQFGGRLEHGRYEPQGGLRSRDFTNFSGSLGFLLTPPAAGEHVTLAVSLARAARQPALEELYFFGVHPGNFAFEIGNAALASERAVGFDASLRWRYARATGEVTYFRNDISRYIFRNPISRAAFERQFGEQKEDGEFPFVQFLARDSVLQGIEAHADMSLTRALVAEIGVDVVRGELKDTTEPLPRMPPLRGRVGLRYQVNAFQAGGEVVGVATQGRVFGEETPTAGYGLLKLFAAYSFTTGKALNTITLRLDNATDRLYRNHLSLIKDFVPEIGRNIKAIYSVRF